MPWHPFSKTDLEEPQMIRTIRISPFISAQGLVLRELEDGRIEIDCGGGRKVIGQPFA